MIIYHRTSLIGSFTVAIFGPFLISFLVHFQSFGSKQTKKICKNEVENDLKMATVNDLIGLFNAFINFWLHKNYPKLKSSYFFKRSVYIF